MFNFFGSKSSQPVFYVHVVDAEGNTLAFNPDMGMIRAGDTLEVHGVTRVAQSVQRERNTLRVRLVPLGHAIPTKPLGIDELGEGPAVFDPVAGEWRPGA